MKKRAKLQGTRKLDCPATVEIRKAETYTDFAVDAASFGTANSLRVAKEEKMRKLKATLAEKGEKLNTTVRSYMRICLSSSHQFHPVGEAANINQTLDKRVIRKIYSIVANGIFNFNEVRNRLTEYVESEICASMSPEDRPSRSNRRFFPPKRDLRNHIFRALTSQKYCKDDQESLRRKIEQWRQGNPNSNFLYRTCSENSMPEMPDGDNARENMAKEENIIKNRFLFVHQEPWQQRLLMRYGKDMVFMDATYKTTKYALPLFFLCVHTNVGYKVTAEFICQYEDSSSIAEALSVIQSWNPTWKPKYFMTDYSTCEIDALEARFPGAQVYICDFHRLQAWQRWIRKAKNGLNTLEQQELLSHLKRVANSRTQAAYSTAVTSLRSLPVYVSNENVKRYVEKTWMSCTQRWVKAFRTQQVDNIADTNNGVEAQNRLFKYEYLPRALDKSVYGIAIMLVEKFIPEAHQTYLQANALLSSGYRRYNRMVPQYLHNRPPHFIKQCLKAKFSAGDLNDKDVICTNLKKGVFSVRSSTDNTKFHTVNFEGPSCTCEIWHKFHFPCKHFFGIFNSFEEFGFMRLPEEYRNSVFLTLDNAAASASLPPANDNDEVDDTVVSPEIQSQVKIPTQPDSVASVNCNVETLRKQLQQALETAKNFTYLIDDPSVLRQSLADVETVKLTLKRAAGDSGGLQLRLSPKRLKVTSSEYHKVFHKKLPLRKRFKRKLKEDADQQKCPPVPEVIDLDDYNKVNPTDPIVSTAEQGYFTQMLTMLLYDH